MAISGGAGIKAGEAFVALSAKDVGLSSALNKFEKKLRSIGNTTTAIGTAMAGVGGVALGAGFAGVIDTLGEVAKTEEIGRAFKITSEQASGLFGMLEQNGGQFKENLEGLVQFGQRVNDALTGVGGPEGEAAQLFKGLSVQAKDLIGLGIDEQFYRVVGAINELGDAQAAQGKLALLGGTDSAKQWQALLNRSTDEIRAQAAASRMSSADMNTARDAMLAYKQATISLTQAWRQVAVALAPTIQQIAEGLVPILKDAANWIKANRGMIVGLAGGLVALTTAGFGLTGLGLTISGVATAVAAVGAVVGAVFTPVGLGVAAVGALAVVLAAAGEEVNTSRSSITMLGEDFSTVWDSIKDAIAAGDMEAVWKTLTNGLGVLWDDLTVGIVEGWHRAMTEVKVALVETGKFIKGFIEPLGDVGKTLMPGLALVGELGGFDTAEIRREADLNRQLRDSERDRRRREMQALAVGNAAAAKAARGTQGDPVFGLALTALFASMRKQADASLALVGSVSRGTFRGAGAAGELSAGGVMQEIANNTKRTADGVEAFNAERWS